MRTASTLIRAATVAAIAIGLAAQPTLAQTSLQPAGAGAEQAADRGGKAPVKTAGKARNRPRLKTLGKREKGTFYFFDLNTARRSVDRGTPFGAARLSAQATKKVACPH